MGAREVVTQFDRADSLGDLLDEQGVAERLAHLLACSGHPRVVQPVVREGPVGRFRLSDLVLMVREHEIESASVDVEMRAEVLLRHRRALDMPARATRPPGCLPLRLAGLRALPHGEVTRVALHLRL